MQTSAQGTAVLEEEEGVVLKAYRDAKGVWTIGAGLTAASGVVTPKAGMVLRPDQATALLQQALRQNYEPAVQKAMGQPKQNEFDAGVLFHWNTGAIARATWVKLWKSSAAASAIRASMAEWDKSGGKVLPGLEKRRQREANILLMGVYGDTGNAEKIGNWVIKMTPGERSAAVEGFRKLGYEIGAIGQETDQIKRFQSDHDLTVDGLIGRATLSTLQRALDARAKAAPKATAAIATGVAASSTDLVHQLSGVPHADVAATVAAGAAALHQAWKYRDVIAAAVAPTMPRVAAFLRSV
ncbi:glycoside hydrolase family protein [Acidimangrovimonas sediminis]|uniref:glycoside hydrolase family protein n=1 Tax=Acidimangrovimonas sediminis TaxID=2056283 RepID=UPI000C80D27B|nr:peptidoglycan-binding protein [Acidimangrovimonas sediminis]